MRTYVIFCMLLFSTNVLANATQHSCEYGKFNIFLTTDKKNDISLEVYKGKTKILSCLLKVTRYDNGKKTASLSETTKFIQENCSVLFDKIASEVKIAKNGAIIRFGEEKFSTASVIDNQDPLKCKIK